MSWYKEWDDATKKEVDGYRKKIAELEKDLAYYREQNGLLWDRIRNLEQSQHDLRQNKKNADLRWKR